MQEIDEDSREYIFGECLLVCMYQGHHDNVTGVNGISIKLERFNRKTQFIENVGP